MMQIIIQSQHLGFRNMHVAESCASSKVGRHLGLTDLGQDFPDSDGNIKDVIDESEDEHERRSATSGWVEGII